MKSTIILISIVIITLTGFFLIFLNNDNITTNTFRVRGFFGERSSILSTYDEFTNFLSNFNSHSDINSLLVKYDTTFFENHSLAIIYVTTGSSASSVRDIGARINNNTVTIRYSVRTTRSFSLDLIQEYFIVAEIPKNISNVVINGNSNADAHLDRINNMLQNPPNPRNRN